MAENDRFYSLLKKLELEDRVVSSDEPECICAVAQKAVDYGRVYEILRLEREKSYAFLSRHGV